MLNRLIIHFNPSNTELQTKSEPISRDCSSVILHRKKFYTRYYYRTIGKCQEQVSGGNLSGISKAQRSKAEKGLH
jgi:hypothetical protein